MKAQMDLWSEITQKTNLLHDCISALKSKGRDRAECEHNYKIALKREIVALHEEKVAWTTCVQMAHGDTDRYNVAALRLKRDLAQADYDVCQEMINGLKLQIRILDSQISREWSDVRN